MAAEAQTRADGGRDVDAQLGDGAIDQGGEAEDERAMPAMASTPWLPNFASSTS